MTEQMGEAGRRRVAEAFSLERMVTSYEQLYRDVTRAAGGAGNLNGFADTAESERVGSSRTLPVTGEEGR